MIRIGTSHFVSVRAATRYYAAYGHGSSEVMEKLIAGEIHVGRPKLIPGQRLVVVDNETGRRWDGRYAIVEA